VFFFVLVCFFLLFTELQTCDTLENVCILHNPAQRSRRHTFWQQITHDSYAEHFYISGRKKTGKRFGNGRTCINIPSQAKTAEAEEEEEEENIGAYPIYVRPQRGF
jgi:hypothetical protein